MGKANRKRPDTKRPHVVRFHLYEMWRIGKFTVRKYTSSCKWKLDRVLELDKDDKLYNIMNTTKNH